MFSYNLYRVVFSKMILTRISLLRPLLVAQVLTNTNTDCFSIWLLKAMLLSISDLETEPIYTANNQKKLTAISISICLFSSIFLSSNLKIQCLILVSTSFCDYSHGKGRSAMPLLTLRTEHLCFSVLRSIRLWDWWWLDLSSLCDSISLNL